MNVAGKKKPDRLLIIYPDANGVVRKVNEYGHPVDDNAKKDAETLVFNVLGKSCKDAIIRVCTRLRGEESKEISSL